MKRIIHITLAVTLFALLPVALLAQDELTLESLAETVNTLTERVDAIEELFADPWKPSVIHTDDGICQSELHASHEWSDRLYERIHQETADAYRAEFGVSMDPADVDLASLSFASEGTKVYLEYVADGGGTVVEEWANCEYLGHSDWVKE